MQHRHAYIMYEYMPTGLVVGNAEGGLSGLVGCCQRDIVLHNAMAVLCHCVAALRGVKRQRHCRTFSQKLSPPLASSFLGTLLLAHVKPLSTWFPPCGCPVPAAPIPHTALQHTIYDTSLCVAVCGGGTDAVYVLIAYLP